MNDIKSAMAKALNEWEDKPVAMHPVVGVAKGTFDYIKSHPGLNKKATIKGLEQRGYKPSSTSSLISAMIKQKRVAIATNGTLVTVVTEHTPLKSSYHAAPKKQPVKQGIAALETQTATEPPKYILRKALDVDALIDTLTIREAITLHAKLSEALGK